MHKALLFLSFVIFFLFFGCSQRKNFIPEHVEGRIVFNHLLKSKLEWSSRNGAILKDGSILGREGQTLLTLGKKSRFLYQTDRYYIIMKDCQNIELIDRVTQESKKYPTKSCTLSANIKNHYLAFMLIDNSYGIYDINTQEMLFNDHGSSVIAIDALNASPIFLDTLVIFPLLDGQLVTISLDTFKLERTVIVHSEKFFSNIIFLESIDSKIFASTPKRLISLMDGKQFDYEANIRDIKFYNGFLYLLTLEGKIIQLDTTLRIVNEITLPYAILSGIVIVNDKLYTMERSGYLIETDLKNFGYRVYILQDFLGKILRKKNMFYDDKRIYYDRYYLDFSRVWKK